MPREGREGVAARVARHETGSRAIVAGLQAMGLTIFGDQKHKMPNVTGIVIPPKVDGERVRSELLHDFGIEMRGYGKREPHEHAA